LTDQDKSILPVEELKNLLGRYRVTAAYFFGSRVEGIATEKSDYDFAILVDKEYEQDDINYLLMELKDEAESLLQNEVDVVLLNNVSIEFKYLVISRGQVIYSCDEDKRTDFEDEVIRDYLDFKPLLDIYRKEVREAVKEGHFYG